MPHRTCGVEQQEARRAHNPEVAGSNPAPASSIFTWLPPANSGFSSSKLLRLLMWKSDG